MKKILFTVLAILPLLSNAQNIDYTDGNCSGDCENGNGTYIFNSGDKYSGAFINGQFNGQGKYIYKSGAYYDGTWSNHKKSGQGVYIYRQSSDKLKYEGAFSNGKFNGQGVLTYKNGSEDRGLWKDDIFQGMQIGEYNKQPVLKKGDTIVTQSNNNKYLLSKQTIVKQGDENVGFLYPYGDFYLVDKSIDNDKTTTLEDLQTKKTDFSAKDAIGYIPKESENQYHFQAIDCEGAEKIYKKFLNYCKWEICRMENTSNLSKLSYQDYEKQISEDVTLNNQIALLNLTDIIHSLSNNMLTDLTDNIFDMETSLRDVLMKSIANFNVYGKAGGQAGACFTTSMNTVEEAFNQQYKDLTTITVNDIVNGKNQKIRDMYKDEFQKSVEKTYHTFFNLLDGCFPNMSKRLIVYKILPEIVNAGMMLAANATIKFSIAPEHKNSLIEHINACKTKKSMLEGYRKEYEQKIENAEHNCLEYTRVINDLKTGKFDRVGNNYTDELLAQIQKYVFGNEQIGVCKVLDNDELIRNGNMQMQNHTNTKRTYQVIILLHKNAVVLQGHIALCLKGDKNAVYFSFNLENDKEYITSTNISDIEYYNYLNRYDSKLILWISKEEFESMYNTAIDLINKQYDILKREVCSTFVKNVLISGGIKGNSVLWIRPRTLYKDIYDNNQDRNIIDIH
jgi:hypothetical protein